MAITIDGTAGTIAGLVAGGLPDASVVDADIAAVASSKLSGALPAISGASLTNLPAGGKVVNTWAIGKTTGTITISSTSTYASINCSADISVTSGNKLLIQLHSGIHGDQGTGGRHYSFNVYFNSVSLGHTSWGGGINHGNNAHFGWASHSYLFQTTVGSTGTYTIEAKANCPTGAIQLGGDGTTASGWGYDSTKMIVWEVET